MYTTKEHEENKMERIHSHEIHVSNYKSHRQSYAQIKEIYLI
jgi:hypothetical protein